MEERRWALQFISVGLISVASRGLRLTFRWSFVRRSMGRRTGTKKVRRRRTDKRSGEGIGFFYGNILVGHTVCRRGRRSRRRSSMEEENGRRNKDVPTNKTAVLLEGTPKAPGQSGPPLISFPLFLACSPQKPYVTIFCFINGVNRAIRRHSN